MWFVGGGSVCELTWNHYRYLRATKWASPEAAIKRLEATLRWRREFGFYTTVTPEYVEPEVCFSSNISLEDRSLNYIIYLIGCDREMHPFWVRCRRKTCTLPRSQ